MGILQAALEQQPLAALFFTIAIGYLLGEIALKGFSLGVGAVLFVALAMGWLAPKAAPPAVVGTFGLSLFLYTVGIQSGTQFFEGLRSPRGLKANLVAAVGVLAAGGLALGIAKGTGLKLDYALGLFAGSGTSTPALQAVLSTLGRDDPAVGYSVAYPFGVAGPILMLSLVFAVAKPRIEASSTAGLDLLEIVVRRPEHVGRRLGQLSTALPPDVRIVALRRDDRNQPASPEILLREEDVLLAVGPTRAALEQAARTLGEEAPGPLIQDRRDLDYLRVYASRKNVVGRTVGDLALPGDKASQVIDIRRGDADLLALPDLVLESGDRIGLLTHRANFPAMRTYFGDSMRGTVDFSYVSIGLGMAIGFLIGSVRIPLPGAGTISMGLSGVLITALILGRCRRAAGLTWTIPVSANLVLRNLGLTLFLAQVGMASGPRFVATVADTGFLMLGLGAAILVALVLPILLLGLLAFRMPYDEVAGIVAGACGNPAILAYANKLAPSDRPDVQYAAIFPSTTLMKILFVSLVPSLF